VINHLLMETGYLQTCLACWSFLPNLLEAFKTINRC
jgi:hypothetical protein